MARQLKRYDPEFNTKLVMALLRGEESQEALARRHEVSSTVLSRWKEQFFRAGAERLKHNGQDSFVTAEIHRFLQEDSNMRLQALLRAVDVPCEVYYRATRPAKESRPRSLPPPRSRVTAEIYLSRSHDEAHAFKPNDGPPDYNDLCVSKLDRAA